MELRITQDDAVMLTIPGTEAGLIRYTPGTPEIDLAMEPLTGDGEAVASAPFRNVAEQVELYWTGATLADQRESLTQLQRLLQLARQRQQGGTGPRIWVQFRPASTDPWYRSEILTGRAIVDDTRLRTGLQILHPHLETTIIWTRRPHWEYAASALGDTAALELSLDGYPGGATVTNDDGNALEIAGDEVLGTLPAPLRLEITNIQNSEVRTSYVYVARGVQGPLTTTHHYAGWSVSGVSATSETLLQSIDLSGEALAAWGGNMQRIAALMDASYAMTDLWLRWKLYWAVTCVWEGPWQRSTYWVGLRDMGAVALPPRPVAGATLASPMELRLYGRRATSTVSLEFLWMQILPVDSWRVLSPAGYGLAYTTRLVDDGITGEVWTDGWDGGGYTPHYSGRGQPVMVEPGRDQTLYVLQTVSSGGGDAAKGRALSVRAWYRPRRVTL